LALKIFWQEFVFAMLLLTTATACLITGILAQLPPSYTLAHTNITLGVKYGSINMTAGSTLDFNGECSPESPGADP